MIYDQEMNDLEKERDEFRSALDTLVKLKDLKVSDPVEYDKQDLSKSAAWTIAREILRAYE